MTDSIKITYPLGDGSGLLVITTIGSVPFERFPWEPPAAIQKATEAKDEPAQKKDNE